MTTVPASPLIHIGYHKTGTSWLQLMIFSAPSAGFVTPWSSMYIADELILPHELDFDASTARDAFAAGLTATDGLVPVLTWERLSGSPHAGGFDSALIARRLAEVFPAGRVLIVVREQRSAILSMYQQYVRDGGIATLKGYLCPRNPAEIPQFRFEHLAYDRLVSYYYEQFGRAAVLVLAYERLVRDPDAFVRRIQDFAGVTVDASTVVPSRVINASLGAGTLAIKRWANRWFVRNSLSPGARYYVKDHDRRFASIDRFIPAVWSSRLEKRWKQCIAELVGRRYAESNARLAALTGEPLAGFGYDVATDTAS